MILEYKYGALCLIVVLICTVPGMAASVDPYVDQNNPGCADLTCCTGVCTEYKIENEAGNPLSEGIYTLSGGTITLSNFIRNSDDEIIKFDWSSSGVAVKAVIVKGGDTSHVYCYPSPVYADAMLNSPRKNDKFPEISHISFCYVPPLNVPEFPAFSAPFIALIALIGLIGGMMGKK